MIDQIARNRYSESNRSKSFMDGIFNATSEAIDLKKENKQILDSISKRDSIIQEGFDKLGKAVTLIFKSIPRQVQLPQIFKTEVTKSVPIKISNLNELDNYFKSLEKSLPKSQKFPSSFVVDNLFELEDYFKSLEKRIDNLAKAVSSVPTPKIEVPKVEFPKIEFPKNEKINLREIVDAIESLKEFLDKPQEDNTNLISSLKLIQQGISALVDKPTYVPPSVTKFDINPLRGQFESTLVSVGTTPTPIPGNAATRRQSLIVFNEDTSKTVRIGGAAVVSTTNAGDKTGLAIPPQTYSPPIGAGAQMILYGIVSTGTANVTVLELENDYTNPGGVTTGTTVGGYNI